MEISVIVSIYNVAEYLDKCILSIIGQTYDKLQIILVDDGSTDESSFICDDYGRKDSRVKVIHKENGGLVSARKAGLYAATGEYIGYVDGDDWIVPDFYEHMLNDLIRYQTDIVETEHFIDAGTDSKRIKNSIPYGKYDTKVIIPIMLCDEEFNECRLRPYLWSKLFKRNLLYKHQMRVDETICCGEDIAVTYPYMLDAKSIYISDYAGYHYVQRSDSMTGMQSPVSRERDKVLILYLKTVFETCENDSEIMQKQLNQYTKSMLLLRQIDFFDRSSEKKKFLPFGGIDLKCRIALYGAGRMGKSVYRYLQILGKAHTVMWADKEYILYQQLGLPMISPDEIVAGRAEYDILLVAVSSRKTADKIQESLMEKGLDKSKMRWLTKDFIRGDNLILDAYIEF